MPITVRLPTALRQYADNSDTIELDGPTAGDGLARLGERFPNLAPHLFNDDGSLRNFVNVFLDEDNIRDLDSGDTPVKDGDELTIKAWCESDSAIRIGFGSCWGAILPAN